MAGKGKKRREEFRRLHLNLRSDRIDKEFFSQQATLYSIQAWPILRISSARKLIVLSFRLIFSFNSFVFISGMIFLFRLFGLPPCWFVTGFLSLLKSQMNNFSWRLRGKTFLWNICQDSGRCWRQFPTCENIHRGDQKPKISIEKCWRLLNWL